MDAWIWIFGIALTAAVILFVKWLGATAPASALLPAQPVQVHGGAGDHGGHGEAPGGGEAAAAHTIAPLYGTAAAQSTMLEAARIQAEADARAREKAELEAAGDTEGAAAIQLDDLSVIEGIGPRIDEELKKAGVISFSQLAATSVDRLQEILSAANLRMAQPDTWPQQAELAAQGRWAELKALQVELNAGRQQ